jgi:hypothetical protein
MLALQVCPGCEKKYRPFYREQNYCDACRNGDNEYDRTDGTYVGEN